MASERTFEPPQHRVLAERPRQDREAKVDRPRLGAVAIDGADATVLGLALLGDVEVGQHLEAIHQAADGVARQRGDDLVQHAVDAQPYVDVGLVGLEVDVAGPERYRAAEDLVEDLGARRLGRERELGDRGELEHPSLTLRLLGEAVADVERPAQLVGVETYRAHLAPQLGRHLADQAAVLGLEHADGHPRRAVVADRAEDDDAAVGAELVAQPAHGALVDLELRELDEGLDVAARLDRHLSPCDEVRR